MLAGTTNRRAHHSYIAADKARDKFRLLVWFEREDRPALRLQYCVSGLNPGNTGSFKKKGRARVAHPVAAAEQAGPGRAYSQVFGQGADSEKSVGRRVTAEG